MTVLYANSTEIKLPENTSTTAKTLTPYDVLLWLDTKNISGSFEQVYSLSKLICTIPATTASVERTFSALKRIKTYLRSTQGQERLSNLALISIEKEMLSELRKIESFYEQVLENFLKIERRLDVLYK